MDMGVQVTDSRTGEVNSEEALMLLFAMHFEGVGSIKRIKEYLGVATLQAAMSEMPTVLQVKGIPTYYLMVNRCVMMLSGVGTGVGFPGPNAAKLLLPSAERYLNGNRRRTPTPTPTPIQTPTPTPTPTGFSFESRKQAKVESQQEASSAEEDTLENWLQQQAGLHGKKLAVALNQCDDGMVESVADLERLRDLGQLEEVFPQSMLRGLVAAALKPENIDISTGTSENENNDGDASNEQPDHFSCQKQKLDEFVAACKAQLETWIEEHRAATAWIRNEMGLVATQAMKSGNSGEQLSKRFLAQIMSAMKLTVETYDQKISEYAACYRKTMDECVDAHEATVARMKSDTAAGMQRGKLAVNTWLVEQTDALMKMLEATQLKMQAFIEERKAEICTLLEANKTVTTLGAKDWVHSKSGFFSVLQRPCPEAT